MFIQRLYKVYTKFIQRLYKNYTKMLQITKNDIDSSRRRQRYSITSQLNNELNYENDPIYIKISDEKQEYFMNKAAQLAFRSNLGHRHGCIIVDDSTSEILSTGYNHTKIHMYHKLSCHAEIDALMKIKRNVDLSNSKMYIVRIGSDNLGNPLKMSKPCEGCTKAILKSGIKKVYYSWSNIDYSINSKKNNKYNF